MLAARIHSHVPTDSIIDSLKLAQASLQYIIFQPLPCAQISPVYISSKCTIIAVLFDVDDTKPFVNNQCLMQQLLNKYMVSIHL